MREKRTVRALTIILGIFALIMLLPKSIFATEMDSNLTELVSEVDNEQSDNLENDEEVVALEDDEQSDDISDEEAEILEDEEKDISSDGTGNSKITIELRNGYGPTGSVSYVINGGASTPVTTNQIEVNLSDGQSMTITATPSSEYELDAMSGRYDSGYMGNNEHRCGNFDSNGELTVTADGSDYDVQVEFKVKSAGPAGPPAGEGPSMNYSFSYTGPDVSPFIRISSSGDVEDNGQELTRSTSASGSFGDKLNTIGVRNNGDRFYVSIEVESDLETGKTARYSSITINGVSKTISKPFGRNTYEVEYQKNETLTIVVAADTTYVHNIMWANEGANVAGSDYDNTETKLVNGSAYVYKVYDNESDMNDITSSIENVGTGCVDSNGRGYIVLEAGNVAEFEFVPKYGHQLVSVKGNGRPGAIGAFDIGAQSRINTYRFVMPNTNVHFYAEFANQKDVVKSSVANIDGNNSEITLGSGELDAGSAQLSIVDSTASALVKDAMREKAEEAGFTDVYSEMSIDLNQVFYKGANDSSNVWSNEHNTLSNPAVVTLSLSEDQLDYSVGVVHKKHDGSIEVIPATVNYDGSVSFEVTGFSDYSIVRTAGHNHKGILVNAKAASCTQDGNIAYYKCRCGKLYKEKTCKNEISENDIIVKGGHVEKFGKVSKAATNSKNGTATSVCKKCKKTLSKKKTVYAAKKISLSTKKAVFNGKVQKPTVIVMDSKNNVLTQGVDYKVKYSGKFKKVGSYKVTVTGTGAYKYTKVLTFKITKK